jgi:hypothetical protein
MLAATSAIAIFLNMSSTFLLGGSPAKCGAPSTGPSDLPAILRERD